jgi:hypothetical protein
MKKLLLIAAVLAGAVSASRAGVNFNFGMGLPVPQPLVVVSHRAPVYASDCRPAPVVYAPVCETRQTVVYNDPHRYTYDWHHGRSEWQRRSPDGNHRRNQVAPQSYSYRDTDRNYRSDDHDSDRYNGRRD